jgi:hypothetical protein
MPKATFQHRPRQGSRSTAGLPLSGAGSAVANHRNDGSIERRNIRGEDRLSRTVAAAPGASGQRAEMHERRSGGGGGPEKDARRAQGDRP